MLIFILNLRHKLMENSTSIKLFESKKIRTHWDETEEQ